MRFEGTLKTWNDDRGFGFIEPRQGGQEVFVHIKAFPAGTGRPVSGMPISFELEPAVADGKSRARKVLFSKPTQRSNMDGYKPTANGVVDRLGKLNVSVLAGFTILFTFVSIVWHATQFFAIAYVAMSLIAYGAYWSDKNAAKSGKWRTTEGTLHMLGLFCGWPGAIIAQQVFRHKTTKQEFRVVFWTTVIANIVILLIFTTPLFRVVFGR